MEIHWNGPSRESEIRALSSTWRRVKYGAHSARVDRRGGEMARAYKSSHLRLEGRGMLDYVCVGINNDKTVVGVFSVLGARCG